MQAARADKLTVSAELGDAETDFIREWAKSFEYSPYRNYPYITSADASRVQEDAVSERGPGVHHLWQRENATPVGLLRIEDMPWDTALYRRRMGRVTHICGDLDDHDLRASRRPAIFHGDGPLDVIWKVRASSAR